MEAQFKINFGSGLETVVPPENQAAIVIDVIFTNDEARATLASINFEWKGDTAQRIFDYVERGASGGKGVAFGLPLELTICDGLVFNLFLNLAHPSSKFSCDEVICPIMEEGGTDWFSRETRGKGFWFLTTIGQLGPSDYKKTPYALSTIPNYTQVISLSFQQLVLAWKLRDIVRGFTDKTTEVTADVTESAIPIVGTPHVTVTVAHVINIVLQIAEVVVTLFAIAFYFKELKSNIIQKKKYKLCMREQDLFKKIASHLGLGFISPIYAPGSPFEDATYMPDKIVMPKVAQNILVTANNALFDRPEDEISNPKSFGYPDISMAEYIQKMETKYSASLKVIGSVMHFQEKTSFNVNGTYIVPNTGEVGNTFNLPRPYGTNLSRLAPYTRISFRTDATELNTIHRYRGTSTSVQITSPFPIDKTHGWGDSALIDLGSALAKRKYYLTEPEAFFNALSNLMHAIASIVIAPLNILIAAINIVIGVINAIIFLWNLLPGVPNINKINKIPPIQNPFTLNPLFNRVGWMETTADAFAEPKSFIGMDVGGDWYLHPQTEDTMSAKKLMADFHGKSLATRGNQWKTFDNNKTPFCCKDVDEILRKNIFQTPENKSGKFTSIKFSIAEEFTPQLDYEINEDYLTGLKETIIIDGTK